MRIIAGIYKGRTISVPDGIRPTRDNVKESVFNILSARIDGARVLDLFSGSGALGLEALSRFAQEIVFVDNSSACTDVIESNISRLSPDSGSASVRIITKDAYASIRLLYNEGKKFDIIFVPCIVWMMTSHCSIKVLFRQRMKPVFLFSFNHHIRSGFSSPRNTHFSSTPI